MASGLTKDQAENIIEKDISRKQLNWMIPAVGEFKIIKGDYGFGKTYYAEILYLQLLNQYKNGLNTVFPMWIDIAEFNNMENKISEILGMGINELIIIADGLDEQSYTEADSIIKHANYIALKYDYVKIILTSRPISIVESLASSLSSLKVTNIQPLSDTELCELINYVADDQVINLNSVFSMDKETVEALRRPFFAILLARNIDAQKSIRTLKSSKIKSLLIDDFINNIFDQNAVLKSDFLSLSIESIYCINSGIDLKKSHIRSNVNDILRTGLVVYTQNSHSVKFALPLIAQWLAAEALFLKLETVDNIITEVDVLFKWKYPLMLFIYRYGKQFLDEIFNPIIRKYPAMMGMIINKGIDNNEIGEISKEACDGSHLMNLIEVFKEGLSENVHVIFLDDFQIHIENYENTNSIEHLSGSIVTRFAVSVNHENWYYYAAYRVLQQQIKCFLEKPSFQRNTAMYYEFIWEASCRAINNGSVRNKPIIIDELLKKTHDKELIEYCLKLQEQGCNEIIPPWPFADLNDNKNNLVWGNYSSQRLLEKTISIYSSAISDYKKIVDVYLGGFRNMLSHYQMMPFTIKGFLMQQEPNCRPWLRYYFYVLPYEQKSCVEFVLEEYRNNFHETKDQLLEIQDRIIKYRSMVSDVIRPSIHEGAHDLFCFNPVTKIVLEWLKQDFKYLEWIT